MELEDLEPRAKNHTFPLQIDLSSFSIEELEARIQDLEDEIERCRKEIDGKKSTRASAESVFKL